MTRLRTSDRTAFQTSRATEKRARETVSTLTLDGSRAPFVAPFVRARASYRRLPFDSSAVLKIFKPTGPRVRLHENTCN